MSGASAPSGPTIASATMPTTIAAEPSASVRGAPRERIMNPDSAPPTANGAENPRKMTPASSTLTPRTTSSAVGTSTITTPDPQFDNVAVSVPSRNAGSRVTRSGTSGSRPRTRSHTMTRSTTPTTIPLIVYALSQPAAATCWIAAVTDAMPNISSTRVTTGTERVRSAGRRGTSQKRRTNATASSATLTPKNARHDHSSLSTDATSGPHAPPMPPSAPQMPTANGCEASSNNA